MVLAISSNTLGLFRRPRSLSCNWVGMIIDKAPAYFYGKQAMLANNLSMTSSRAASGRFGYNDLGMIGFKPTEAQWVRVGSGVCINAR